MSMILPRLINDYEQGCDLDDAVDSAREFELGLHIAALFALLLTSTFGALFPIVANRARRLRIPKWVFFSVKHFGTGVIIATAFIHLLPSAFSSLTSPCLPTFFTKTYPSLAGLIAMIAMLVIFFVEFASSRYLAQIDEKVMAMQLRESGSQNTVIEPVTKFLTRRKVVINGRRVGISAALAGEAAEAAEEIFVRASHGNSAAAVVDEESALLDHQEGNGVRKADSSPPSRGMNSVHRGHHHYDPPPLSGSDCPGMSDATRKSQLLAVAIMEGGLCFHSIFVGLTLAVATGGEFISLLSAIMFHQTFEGMGLGARIATLSFPRKSIRPYCMGMAFAVVTPIGMAIGLSIRTLYSPTSAAALITNGVFDSISSGLLIYASLVELLAHEFLMGEMRLEGLEKAIFAGVCIVAGAAAMSFLGLWV